jgi:hypothetical protein
MLFSWLKAIYNGVEIGERLDRKGVRFFCVDSNCDLFDRDRQSRKTSSTNIFRFQQTNKKKTNKLEILVARVKTTMHDSKNILFLNQKKQEILAM